MQFNDTMSLLKPIFYLINFISTHVLFMTTNCPNFSNLLTLTHISNPRNQLLTM